MKPARRDPLAPLKKRTHADLVREVVKAVNLLPGVFVFPVDVSVGAAKRSHGMRGVSDVIGWAEWCLTCEKAATPLYASVAGHRTMPRFVAFEIKIGRDKLRPAQQIFLQHVRDAGGIGLEIREVMEAVNALR